MGGHGSDGRSFATELSDLNGSDVDETGCNLRMCNVGKSIID